MHAVQNPVDGSAEKFDYHCHIVAFRSHISHSQYSLSSSCHDHDRGFGSGCVSEQEEKTTESRQITAIEYSNLDVVSKVLQLNNPNAFLPAVKKAFRLMAVNIDELQSKQGDDWIKSLHSLFHEQIDVQREGIVVSAVVCALIALVYAQSHDLPYENIVDSFNPILAIRVFSSSSFCNMIQRIAEQRDSELAEQLLIDSWCSLTLSIILA